MKPRRLLAALAGFSFLFVLAASAQQSPAPAQFSDPANLRGERVKPRDGRELPIDQGARGLEQMLRKLNTRASLMLIVAHPDDEDGGMLTYYSRGLGARVAVLTLTRGEGGQNAMTGDFEDALGLLRTQELLSADRYLGVDQFFGTEVDFGFSKTKEEAFSKWTHERVLYDAVRSIRLYRPLVIAAVFIGGVTDGHGQHQVSGQIAQEAFKAAADPAVFPDMIAEGILPWQALKVYARVPMQSISDKGLFDYATGKYAAPRFENYVTGEVTTTTPSADVIVHEGTPDKLLSDNPSDPPRTYVQFARIGLGLQKSQIGNGFRVPPAGAFDASYHRYGSRLESQSQHETSFFDGIDTSILGLRQYHTLPTKLVQTFAENINDALKKFDPEHPEGIASGLVDAIKTCDALVRSTKEPTADPIEMMNALHELRIKRVQLNDALTLALGITLDAAATTPSADVAAGMPLSIDTIFATKSHSKVFGQDQMIFTSEQKIIPGFMYADSNPATDASHPVVTRLTVKSGTFAVVTRPYFSRNGSGQPFYNLSNPAFRNAPATPPASTVHADIAFEGADFEISRIVHAGIQPINIVPSKSVSSSPTAAVLPIGQPQTDIIATLLTTDSTPTNINVQAPKGWSIEAKSIPGSAGNFFRTVDFFLHAQATFTDAQIFHITAETSDHDTYAEGYRPIGYGDLPRTNYYTPATVRVVPVDLNLPRARIAYLPGTGDAVPEALASINLKPDILTVADLTPANLAQYDTVILGVRTYNAHPDLHGAPTQALIDYARNGGNVLVQYQTTEFTAADAPYPLSLGSNEKVVDETDAVQLLDSTAPFLTMPNRITPADFNDWIEERGHGFLSTWDPHYTALTETHDPDQDPQRGGLITTKIGKGRWTYCAFALYRQLPEAVPGAYRLFVNLISPSLTSTNK